MVVGPAVFLLMVVCVELSFGEDVVISKVGVVGVVGGYSGIDGAVM